MNAIGHVLTYQLQSDQQNWIELHGLFGLPKELIPCKLPESRLQIAGESVRYDWSTDGLNTGGWAVTIDPKGVAILDLTRQRYRRLPIPTKAPDKGLFEVTGRSEKTPWGNAVEVVLHTGAMPRKVAAEQAFRVVAWLLPNDLPQHELGRFWSVLLPPLANTELPSGVLYRLEYGMHAAAPQAVRLQLVERRDAEIDPEEFSVPKGFEEGALGDASDAFRQKHETELADNMRGAHLAGLGELGDAIHRVEAGERPTPGYRPFATGPMEEHAKLLIHQRVLDEVVDTINFVVGLINDKTSRGLTFGLGQILRDVEDNAPDTAAHSLLVRLLLFHLLLELREWAAEKVARAALTWLLALKRAGADLGFVSEGALRIFHGGATGSAILRFQGERGEFTINASHDADQISIALEGLPWIETGEAFVFGSGTGADPWIVLLRNRHTIPALLVETNNLVDSSGNPAALSAATITLSPDRVDNIEQIRRLLDRLDSNLLQNTFSTLWNDGDPPPLLTVVNALTRDVVVMSEHWLAYGIGPFELEPPPRMQQRSGRNKGWRGNRYQEDAVAELVDVEVDVNHIDIRFSNDRTIGRPSHIPAGDPLFLAIDLLEQQLGRPARDRVGMRSTIRIDEISIDLTVATFPTTRSLVLVGLFLLCPPCVPLLWQFVLGRMDLSDIRVFMHPILANDPLHLEDPHFEVRVGPADVGDVDVLAFAFNALLEFPPLLALQTALINLVGNVISTSIVNGIMHDLQAVVGPPEDFLVRLQPLLTLNREGHRQFLENTVKDPGKPATEQEDAAERLDRLKNHTPEGINHGGFRTEGSGSARYAMDLAIRRPGLGGNLVHLPPGAPLEGDASLLLSHDVLRYFLDWASYGLAYHGRIYRAANPDLQLDGNDEIMDFWTHAPLPRQLGERPDYQTHPPRTTPGDQQVEDWVSYSAVADVSSAVCRYLDVDNPAPDEPIAELCVTVRFDVGVTTYTPTSFQVCEDLSRLGEWLDRTGGFTEPFDPSDPLPPWARGLRSIRRTRDVDRLAEDVGLSAEVLDSLGVLLRRHGGDRLAGGFSDGTDQFADPADATRSAASRDSAAGMQNNHNPGFGSPGRGFGHTVVCRTFTGWDVAGRETWLEAQLTLRIPVLFGLGDTFPDTLRFLPLLTYRIDTERIQVGELDATAPEGPLDGLLLGPNRAWLIQAMKNHPMSLINLGRAAYARDRAGELTYAYGLDTLGVGLTPDGYAPRALLTLHPDFWPSNPRTPPHRIDAAPPYITLQSFGGAPRQPNLAINFHLVTNILRRVRGMS